MKSAICGVCWIVFGTALLVGCGSTPQSPTPTDTAGGSLGLEGPELVEFTGTVGGPYSPPSSTHQLLNRSTQPIVWQARSTASWLRAVQPSQAIAPGKRMAVTVEVDPEHANALSAGSYEGAITIHTPDDPDRSELAIRFSLTLTESTTPIPTPEAGALVSVIETEAPSQSPFLLRAVVPLPSGVLTDATSTPWMVEDSDGTLVPTQVVPVTRFANVADGASMAEVIARVSAPAGSAPGQRIRYNLKVASQPALPAQPQSGAASFLAAQPQIDPSVAAMLGQSGALRLRAEDVDGNQYEVDLLVGQGSVRYLKSGALMSQVRTFGTMQLTQAAPGSSGCAPYPHLFGVHAYLRSFAAEGVLGLDLRISNGQSNASGAIDDDALGPVYFKRIDLIVPQGFSVTAQSPDLHFQADAGTEAGHQVVSLVGPLGGNAAHLFPATSHTTRRLAIHSAANAARARAILDEEGLGFVVPAVDEQNNPTWAWQNPTTQRYFAPGHRLPDAGYLDLDAIRAQHQDKLTALRQAVESGAASSYPFHNGAHGAFFPAHAAYGGVTGGGLIEFTPGADIALAASRAGFLFGQLEHRAYNDRQKDAYLNVDGEQTSVSDWLQANQTVPFAFYDAPLGNSDPFGYGSADTCMLDFVQNNNLTPSYQDSLNGFKKIDMQHLIRYTRGAKVLAWLGNDALAKDDIRRTAAIARLSFHEFWVGFPGNDYGSSYGALQVRVAAEPGTGMKVGRADGWALDIINAAYAIGDDSARADLHPWYEMLVDVWSAGQIACGPQGGLFIRKLSDKFCFGEDHWGGQPWETLIMVNGLLGAHAAVFEGRDSARADAVRTMIERVNQFLFSPGVWNVNGGVPSQMAVASLSPMQLYCEASDFTPTTVCGKDLNYSQHVLAATHKLLQDQEIVSRVVDMFGFNSPADLLAHLTSNGTEHLENRAALIAMLQSLVP